MAIDLKRNTTTVQPEIANTKRRKKNDKAATPEQQFHETLMRCSKSNDLSTALSIYNSSASTGTPKLNPHHFNTLLHIFSNNATTTPIVNDAFRVFDHMIDSNIRPSEATITSMVRIATSDSAYGGDWAFELVKNMGKKYGLTPKIRTYDPALFTFCRRVEHVEKAYEVEKHMVASGLLLEEREIAALLQVSAQAGRGEKVYEYMLKLISCVDYVGEETAKIVETWFQSEAAGEVGREDRNTEEVEDAILRNGGGWHGMGWFGKGKWNVRRSKVGSDGCCVCCGERLACVDVGQIETEKFAESVASLAKEREVVSNFSDFQEWLNDHVNDYDTIIDAANVGFYQQNYADGGFCITQVKAVVEELFERSRGKLPLVVLHNKRVMALMENPCYKKILEDWQAHGALYATPSGSNDDWYWLYATIKLKCLLVTNDEMRDHIFELLSMKHVPKWKERHLIRYSFTKGCVKLEMPHSYSTTIQESKNGSWHLPLKNVSNIDEEKSTTWICVTRQKLNTTQTVD